MHTIEPYFAWQYYYNASADALSPFYNKLYSEFFYTHKIYNYVIHPQWDSMGSETLFIKILYADYSGGFAVIEFIGEWNDAIENDIMILKREIIDELIHQGVNKFICIGENVLNFHSSDDSYYEEWFDDVPDGYVVFLNFKPHVIQDFVQLGVDQFICLGGKFNNFAWRTYVPTQLCNAIHLLVTKRLGVD